LSSLGAGSVGLSCPLSGPAQAHNPTASSHARRQAPAWHGLTLELGICGADIRPKPTEGPVEARLKPAGGSGLAGDWGEMQMLLQPGSMEANCAFLIRKCGRAALPDITT